MSEAGKRESPRKFVRIAAAGMLFQGGAAAVDTTTIVAALVHGLTGSPLAVGAAAAISRYGWLFPQIFVAHLAQGRRRRMPFYAFGAFGRAACLTTLGVVLWLVASPPNALSATLFFTLWTAYAFIGGVVAVPYNDIVARAIPSSRRSRLLALRFFGGGALALLVATAAHRILRTAPFPGGYALVFLMGAMLMFLSAFAFLSAGEPPAPPVEKQPKFSEFVLAGFRTLRSDAAFRLFLYTRWWGGAVTMSLPFYILEAGKAGIAGADTAYLLALQTAGSLLSNPLWGWWGDRRGKGSLLVLAAMLGAMVPAAVLLWMALGWQERETALLWFGAMFFVIGAASNGDTIALLGYLMEISPEHRRPAYSGYFSMLAAPAALLPLAGAWLAELISFPAVFAASLCAACFQLLALRRLMAAQKLREIQ